MKINIVVPIYNHERYIAQCLNSIVNAYSDEVHVIACDDCSSDQSFSVAQQCLEQIDRDSSSRITYTLLRNETNKGVCITLNRCIDELDAEYCYLIASDDYLIDGALDRAITLIKSSGYDALISDCRVVGDEGEALYGSAFFEYRKSFRLGLQSPYIRDELVMNWAVPGPALLIRSAVYDRVGRYFPGLKAEDREFYLRLLAGAQVGFSDHKIACYRLHGTNSSASTSYMEVISDEMSNVNHAAANLFSGVARKYLQTFAHDLSGKSADKARRYRKKMYRRFKIKLKLLNFLRLI